MQEKEVLDELKTILVTRLKFDPRRAAEMTSDTPLPRGVEGGAGLDSLDFIELSIALEERFGSPWTNRRISHRTLPRRHAVPLHRRPTDPDEAGVRQPRRDDPGAG
jgi:acyl carrier protein